MSQKVDLKFILTLVASISGAMIFFYSTFATVQYVEVKHQSVVQLLNDIKDRVVRIEEKQNTLLRRK